MYALLCATLYIYAALLVSGHRSHPLTLSQEINRGATQLRQAQAALAAARANTFSFRGWAAVRVSGGDFLS